MLENRKKCGCGFGASWFCVEGYSSHEFNRGPNPTAKIHEDRNPEAIVSCHISGTYVYARIEVIKKTLKFHYKDYASDKAAFQAGIDWVNSFFMNKKSDQKQLSLLTNQ